MVDEFYATIKLITGEEIFGSVFVEEDMENPIILITHPVTMKMINAIEGSMVKLNTWLNVPGDDPVVIKWDRVVTMTEIKDKAIISIYNNYLEDEKFYITKVGSSDNNVKNKLTDKMGYISTVNDARKYLEDIYKTTEDKKES